MPTSIAKKPDKMPKVPTPQELAAVARVFRLKMMENTRRMEGLRETFTYSFIDTRSTRAKVKEDFRTRASTLTDKEKAFIRSMPYFIVHINSHSNLDLTWLEAAYYAKSVGKAIIFIEQDGYGEMYIPEDLLKRLRCQVIPYGPGCVLDGVKLETYEDARRFLLDRYLAPRSKLM